VSCELLINAGPIAGGGVLVGEGVLVEVEAVLEMWVLLRIAGEQCVGDNCLLVVDSARREDAHFGRRTGACLYSLLSPTLAQLLRL